VNKVSYYFPEAGLADMAEMRRLIEETAVSLHANQDALTELLLAANEALTNIIVHGYQSQPGPIEIEIVTEGTALIVHLYDRAPLFDPTAVPPPDTTLPLEQRQPGGLGVHMMRQFTNQLQYRIRPAGGNELILVKQCG
jgi:serine/threonine-protein kinase RsbW